MREHSLVPADPQDGDIHTCWCGVSHQFAVLEDGIPGEWVDISNPRRGERYCPQCCAVNGSAHISTPSASEGEEVRDV